MRKSYCTQNNGNCSTCSLVNYGLDCANNPLSSKTPTQTRYTRMMSTYDGFKGERTVESVLSQIPAELQKQLTGKQLGMVMSAVNKAYHNGKASLGGISIEDDCIWFPWGGEDNKGQLIPIAALKTIRLTTTRETQSHTAPGGWETSTTITKHNYTMDYTEEF
jgi:hypothetical protein